MKCDKVLFFPLLIRKNIGHFEGNLGLEWFGDNWVDGGLNKRHEYPFRMTDWD